jgi:hypothetical protein
MEEKMKEAKEFNLLDIHISAFLSLHGVDPKLEQKNGKIVFTFPASEQVYRLMNRFNGGEDVIAYMEGRRISFDEVAA